MDDKLKKRKRKAELLLDLKDHGGMKELLTELRSIIESINNKLLSDDKLETQDRELLLADRARCRWLEAVFEGQELTLKKINKRLEDYD